MPTLTPPPDDSLNNSWELVNSLSPHLQIKHKMAINNVISALKIPSECVEEVQSPEQFTFYLQNNIVSIHGGKLITYDHRWVVQGEETQSGCYLYLLLVTITMKPSHDTVRKLMYFIADGLQPGLLRYE